MKSRLLLFGLALAAACLCSCDDSPSDSTGISEWTWHPVLAGATLNAVSDDGVSFAVVGDEGRFQTSLDGRSWDVSPAGTDGMNDVVGTDAGWISVGASGRVIFKARNGEADGATSIPGGPDLFGIAASNSILVVVGANGFIASAAAWDDWTPRVSPTEATLEDVHWNGTRFVAVGHSGTILVSPDGVSWSEVLSGTQQDLAAVTVGPLNSWLAVGPDGTVVRSSFPEANVWEGVIETRTLHFNDVIWTGTRFVSVGPGGYIAESSDNGRSWFKETSNTTQNLRRLVSSHGRLIGVGTGTTILLSETPGSWTAANPGADVRPFRAMWTGSRFVVAANQSILTSLDGSLWSEAYHGTNILLRGIAQSPSMLVAACVDSGNGSPPGVMVGSADGVHWGPISGALSNQTYRDVTWGNSGFLAISQGLEGAMSTDGQTWNRVALPADFYRVAWGNGIYLALGESVIGFSANGIDWEYVNYPFETNETLPSDVAWLDGSFVLAGPGDHISSSPDGRTWDVHVTGSGIDIVAVTRRGPWTYATGGFGTILASSNFQTWSEQESGTTNVLQDLVASDRTVLAVGASGTILTLD